MTVTSDFAFDVGQEQPMYTKVCAKYQASPDAALT